MGLSKYIKPKTCPVCKPDDCEEATKHDGFMPKGKKRVCWLCYSCGASQTTPPLGDE